MSSQLALMPPILEVEAGGLLVRIFRSRPSSTVYSVPRKHVSISWKGRIVERADGTVVARLLRKLLTQEFRCMRSWVQTPLRPHFLPI